MVLGKHSGRHAFEDRLKVLGLSLEGDALNEVFAKFKDLADKKKVVNDQDIEALVLGATAKVPETWKLDNWAVNTSSMLGAAGTIRLQGKDGHYEKHVHMGDGPVDAMFKAINEVIGKEPELELYEIGAITGSSTAQGETTVKISWNDRHYNGRGLSTDIIESSIRAYLAAVNAMEWDLRRGQGEEGKTV
jgi:2-isopropylmalate synthase